MEYKINICKNHDDFCLQFTIFCVAEGIRNENAKINIQLQFRLSFYVYNKIIEI
jgi:hypothetical protein